jgi:hypothetical protein
MGGNGRRSSVLRVLAGVVAICALVGALWMTALGRRQQNRAGRFDVANASATAKNRSLNAQLSQMAAANTRLQTRIDQVGRDRGATVEKLDALVSAWNAWLDANNALVHATNGYVGRGSPSGSAARTSLEPHLQTIQQKEAAFRTAVVAFAANAARVRRDLGGKHP